MFDYRDYVIVIAAIFLTLALGILIGISYGEDFLIFNQRNTIDLMEQELARLKKNVAEQASELQRWEAVRPVLLKSYQNRLSGKQVLIITFQDEQAAEIHELLTAAGAKITLAIFPEEQKLKRSWTEQVAVLQLLLGNLASWHDFSNSAQELALDLRGELFHTPPDYLVLLLAGDDLLMSFQIIEALWENLNREGIKCIIGLPWTEEWSHPAAEVQILSCYNLIDNIDTFWGKLALLEMILHDYGGHYGFGPASSSLLPQP